ncbi:MAG: hypothetical protein RIG77_14010 [Cyclobacteriaceae bacterium]
MIRKVLKVLKFLLKTFLIILVSILILFGLIYGGFYIDSTIYDKSMSPARNPNEIFVNTGFQDSVVRHTQKGEYFLMVKKYVEFMIVNGRDRYGKVHSPLFATTLDRHTGNAFGSNPPAAPKGIRERDRTYRGANPANQNGLYGLMYQLSNITGDNRYAKEADKGVEWFFKNCQMPRTNLMAWGEHMGWDFFKERIIYWKFQFWIHELKGYSHWDRAWELAPEPVEKFSMALWDHQIYAKEGAKAGEYSRHANSLIHYPFSGRGFPSHGGKYIEVWARAWQKTGDKEYLRAINTLLDYFERNTSPESGAINYATSFPEHYSLNHNMGLASSLYKSMEKLPDTLALRMKLMADQTDSIYLSFDHDPTLNGKGFVKYAHVHTLEPGEFRWVHAGGKFRTSMWSNGYGAGNHIGAGNNCLERYRQTGIEKFKELFLATAEAYYDANPPVQDILYPDNYSGAIGMLRNAYKLTGDKRFLDRAIEYTEISIKEIMDETSPLPKASNKSDHYEAITGANGFMGSLLGLWLDVNNVNSDSATEYSEDKSLN